MQKKLFFSKKKIKIFWKRGCHRISKRSCTCKSLPGSYNLVNLAHESSIISWNFKPLTCSLITIKTRAILNAQAFSSLT
jgi:hypothetical protein